MTAAKKQKLEAVDDVVSPLVEIPYRGKKFVVPRSRDKWSTEGLAWLAEKRWNMFVKAQLEIAKPGQWAELCALCPTREEFNEFFTVFGKAVNEECTD